MKIKTKIRAADIEPQHNQTRPVGLKIKTKVRAAVDLEPQHNQTRPVGLKIKTKVRAGGMQMQHNPTLARA